MEAGCVVSERRRGSLRGLIEPLAEPQSGPGDSMFGPEPPEGWHRGIPGLRKRTPDEHSRWLADGGVYTADLYAPEWSDADEDLPARGRRSRDRW